MSFCIPPLLAEKLKAAASRGEIDIEKMYNMTSEERKSVFSQYVDKSVAKQINLGFEKAMISTKVTALQKWAQSTFKGSEELAKKKKDVVDRINELNDAGLLTPAKEEVFYQDLVSEKLGLTVTQEEAVEITKLAEELQNFSSQESDFGTPTEAYFVARKKIQDYVETLTPSSRLKIATSIIGRANMLARISSPFLNIESNSVMAALQAFSRRLENRSVGGVNNQYAKDYIKFAVNIYQKTGYDITRMQTIEDDLQVRGEEILTSQGKGTIRRIGRFYEDTVFKTMQGLPDVVYASFAASDRSNIESTKMAREEGLKGSEAKSRALAIFKDATRIDPKTKEGRQVRASAMADAMYSTYTNKSVYADVSLGIRKIFNIASGDAMLGDQIMPFVKTPANVIGTGINMSGIGLPIDATYRMFKVLRSVKKGENVTEAMKDEFTGFGRTVIQAGLGLTFAYILSRLFEPDDFIGEYPVSEKERQLLVLRNATTNSVKIGDRWVSLDYFGPLAAAMTGILYAKKYGVTLPEKSYQYFKGVVSQSSKLPGFENMTDLVDYLNGLTNRKSKTMGDEAKDLMNYLIGFTQSRITPGILYDFAKISDTFERRTTGDGDMFARLKSVIPGLRETLPSKKTIYGEEIKTEPAWSILMFGSRVKTSKDNKLTAELLNLDSTGNLPSITDVSKTSPRAKELKNQIGNDEFEKFMIEYGTVLSNKSYVLINDSRYDKLTPEKKKAKLDTIKSDLFEKMLKKYGYKKPKN